VTITRSISALFIAANPTIALFAADDFLNAGILNSAVSVEPCLQLRCVPRAGSYLRRPLNLPSTAKVSRALLSPILLHRLNILGNTVIFLNVQPVFFRLRTNKNVLVFGVRFHFLWIEPTLPDLRRDNHLHRREHHFSRGEMKDPALGQLMRLVARM